MLENWKIDNKSVTPPLESENLTIDLSFKKGTLSESQPVLSFDSIVLTNSSKNAYICAREKNGPYQEIPVSFSFQNKDLFNGYLTEPNFLLQLDQIEVKPVSKESTDGLVEKLSAIESSLLKDLYNYQELEFLVEKVDIKPELLQLQLSSLFYAYVLYTQIKELNVLISEAVEATVNAAPPGLSFGSIVALVLKILIQAVFVAITVIQLIKYAKQAKELLIPKKKLTKVISLFELARAPLAYIGYDLVTDIDDMHRIGHWASGNVDKDEYYPRSSDRCGSALGALNFIVEKFSARVFVRGNTVFIVNYYSPLFFNSSGYVLDDFPRGDYEENLDDMVGTREHIYSVDFEDQWTLENFKGTEYKIRANISDPKKSTIKGLSQKNYQVALCNRKDELNALEKLWMQFVSLVKLTVDALGGNSGNLKIPNRIGMAKVSTENLGIAKIVWFNAKRLPSNHREQLSAKSDEEKFHFIESHVRNPRAKTRIYGAKTEMIQKYNFNSLNCNLNNNIVFTPEGTAGTLNSVKWKKSKDNAALIFEIEDVNRPTKLIETFDEPEK